MTHPSDADPVVLAGDPDSVHVLEGGDDDLPPLRPGDAAAEVEPAGEPAAAPRPDPGEWAAADALLEGQPTELGE